MEPSKRKTRSDSGSFRFTDPRTAITQEPVRHGPIRIDDLHDCLGKKLGILHPGTFANQIRLLANAGFLEQRKILHGEPTWVTATQKACAEFGHPDWGVKYPPLDELRHARATYLVTVALVEQWSPKRFETEREVRSATPKRTHSPDAIFHLDSGRVAIEVEISQKKADRLDKILVQLLENFDWIFYFTTPRLKPGIEAALARIGYDAKTSKIQLHDIAVSFPGARLRDIAASLPGAQLQEDAP